MQNLTSTLRYVLLAIELLTAIIAFGYFFKLRYSYWKWFIAYLIIISCQELYWFFNDEMGIITKQQYYAFVGIPIQYLFFYWLYALKSLKKNTIFASFVLIYIASLILDTYLIDLRVLYSLNIVVGSFLLTILVVMEYLKQIKTDNILKFKENKMFYINLGVVLFYIGTLPFFAFYRIFLEAPFKEIGDWYYLYFRISVCLMYILFICSFIWGKQPLK